MGGEVKRRRTHAHARTHATDLDHLGGVREPQAGDHVSNREDGAGAVLVSHLAGLLRAVVCVTVCDLLSEFVDAGELHACLGLFEGLLESRNDDGAFVSVLHVRLVHVLDDDIEPRGVDVLLLEVFGLKKVRGINSGIACAKKGYFRRTRAERGRASISDSEACGI